MPTISSSGGGGGASDPLVAEWTARGLVSEPFPVTSASAGSVLSAQTLYLTLNPTVAGRTINSVAVSVFTAAAGTSPTMIKLGVYDSTGVLLGATANLAADAGWLTTGNKVYPLTAAVAAPGPCYGAMLLVGAFGSTQLQPYKDQTGFATLLPFGSGLRKCCRGVGSFSDLTTPITFQDGTQSFWIGFA